MPISFRCPSCNAELTLGDAAAGRKGKCPHCKGDITVPASSQAGALPPPAPAPEPFAVVKPAEPVGFSAEQPAYATGSLPAHHGPIVLTLGIIGAVFGVLGLPILFCGFCCPPLGFTGSMLSLPFSIIAVVMGIKDLRHISEGTMNPEGKGLTQAGMICGGVGIVLGTICTIVSFIQLILFLIAAGSQPSTSYSPTFGFRPVPTLQRSFE